jgi:16S rRNA (uracil1498-N3)-methyltransferase
MSTINRFFVEESQVIGQPYCFGREYSHQIRSVLHLHQGEKVMILDNSGFEYSGVISNLEPVTVMVNNCAPCHSEPSVEIHLFFGLLKGDKIDDVFAKGTELGVGHFHPMMTTRCVARDPGPSKRTRWERIVKEAAEQSGRGRLPTIHDLSVFEDACKHVVGTGIIPWEEEEFSSVADSLPLNAKKVSIYIGPEGGFEEPEIVLARRHGIVSVTLGSRILRADTASLASVTAVMFYLGQFAREYIVDV